MKSTQAQKGTILLVDDNPTNLGVLFDALTQSEFKGLLSPNGERAIIQAEKSQPDLILLDVLMPGIDGFETCRRLKTNPATRDIPIIVLTASGAKDLERQCLELGVQELMHKPYDSAYLMEKIAFYLGE